MYSIRLLVPFIHVLVDSIIFDHSQRAKGRRDLLTSPVPRLQPQTYSERPIRNAHICNAMQCIALSILLEFHATGVRRRRKIERKGGKDVTRVQRFSKFFAREQIRHLCRVPILMF